MTDDFERLIEHISIRTLSGLRDRAIIALLTHRSARVEDIVAMQVRDYYRLGGRRWVRLMANGVERLQLVAGRLETYMDEYLAVARIEDDPTSPLFRRLLYGGNITSQSVSPGYVKCKISARVRSAMRSETGSRTKHHSARNHAENVTVAVSENFTKRKCRKVRNTLNP